MFKCIAQVAQRIHCYVDPRRKKQKVGKTGWNSINMWIGDLFLLMIFLYLCAECSEEVK